MEHDSVKIGNLFRCVSNSMEFYCKATAKNVFPLIQVDILSDGSTRTVSAKDLRPIPTTEEHLIKLGFLKETVGRFDFFVLGDVKISWYLFDYTKPRVISKYRLVDNWRAWENVHDYVNNDVVDIEKFNKDFKDLNEINELLDTLKKHNIPIKPYEEFLAPIW